jgi:competence protein ComEC
VRHFSDACLPKGVLPWQKLVIAYVLGIWSLKYPWAGLTALLILFIFIPFKSFRMNFTLVGVFIISFGLAWFRLPDLPSTIPQELKTDERVLVRGQAKTVTFLPGQRQRIILGELVIVRQEREKPLPGKLAWTWQDAPEPVFPGQEVQAHLKVRPVHGLANFGVWNSEFFWRTQNVLWRSYVKGEHFWFRVKGEKSRSSRLRQSLRERTVSGFDISGLPHDKRTQVQGLGLALFFGDRHLLDQHLIDSIRLASLAHTLALSGLHLGIMAGMGFMLAGIMGFIYPRIYLYLPFVKLGILLAAPLCLVYIWMGQAPPTLVRSGIMFASWGLFLFRNQKRVLLDGLFLAAGIITLIDPWSVFDLRLQLSVAAVAGISLFLPLLEGASKKVPKIQSFRILKYFLGLAGVTLTANLALLPVQAWTFNYISPHLYLNLIWLPVLGLAALPAGFAGLFMSIIPGLEWLGNILFWVSGYIFNYFIMFLEFLDSKNLLYPIITYRPPWQHVIAFWLGLILVINVRLVNLKIKAHVLGMFLLLFLIVSPQVNIFFKTGLQLRVLDVGQGQAVVLELPGNKRILVDGGGSWNPEFDLGRQVLVPSLTWRERPESIKKIILSHAHVDHYGGLIYPLKYLGAGKYLHNGIWPGEAGRNLIEAALSRQSVPERALTMGDSLVLGGGLAIEVLHPENPLDFDRLNNTSLVLRLVWEGQGMALIPGDLEAEGMNVILDSEQDLSAHVLLVPHHGSRTSASTRFYEAVDPEIAALSRGVMNRFKVPHQEVLDIISGKDIELYDTAVHGEIIISWACPESRPAVRWARKKLGPKEIPYWF